MLIRTLLDRALKPKKPEEAVEPPVIVRVNDFSEAALTAFTDAFQKALQSGQPVVPIVIDSYGGECYSLMAMQDIIASSPLPVATICVGKAMSCGALLLASGTPGYRFAAPTSTILIHDVSSGARGKVHDVIVAADETKRIHELLYKQMARQCGHKEGYFLDLLHENHHADIYLDARATLRHGIVDFIRVPVYETRVEVLNKFDAMSPRT